MSVSGIRDFSNSRVGQLTTSGYKSALRVGGAVFCMKNIPKISKKVSEWIKVNGHLGTILNELLPQRVKNLANRCASYLGAPVSLLQVHLYDRGYRRIAFSKWYTNLISPVIEELIFRLAAQNGIRWVLLKAQVPNSAATVTSILVIALLFGLVHNEDLRSAEFFSTFTAGAILGALQAYGGLYHGFIEAVVAHVSYNTILDRWP